ncbi:hypothetical protein C8A00DRAFT_37612 [Chaetomidium leptoderma]|uniref:Uncharacterized protein n=1 Tax=Chaetomidium leptoderma TaxID=669021 RepID=A0AAN6ZS37_9PEZI|nr:hypothetical protein C8A00DRAFT_37612 [Chaetomidium leptoderma]
MKFQLITTAAALLVVSVAALPAPQTDNHGLIPDTDDWVDDGTTFEDTEAGAVENIQARAVEDIEAPVEDSIEVRTVAVNETTNADDFVFTDDFDFALDRLLSEIDAIPDEVLEKGDEALHQWLVEHGNREGNEKLKRDTDNVAFDGGADDASIVERAAFDAEEDSSILERAADGAFDAEEEDANIAARTADGAFDGEEEGLSIVERGELVARASLWKITKCVAAIVQLIGTTAVPAAKLLRIKKYIKALGGAKQAVKLMLGATSKAEKLRVGGKALVNLAAELLGISTVKKNCF